jgi:hypothetical protein
MKIECLIKRVGGTEVVLDGQTYEFLPVDQKLPMKSPHVAEVLKEKHQVILLGIPEAYAEVGADKKQVAQLPTETLVIADTDGNEHNVTEMSRTERWDLAKDMGLILPKNIKDSDLFVAIAEAAKKSTAAIE